MPSDLTLPVIDLANLSSSIQNASALSGELSTAFSISDAFFIIGFAYLINAPISLTYSEIFILTHDLFSLSHESKMKVAKKTFRSENSNIYRGYFPAQSSNNNLKEGFEIGRVNSLPQSLNPHAKFNLDKVNV